MKFSKTLSFILCIAITLSACQMQVIPAGQAGRPRVLAVESFLTDITQQVAGTRLQVETLIPVGIDPHAFEVTPRDVARISHVQVMIANGAGYEEWLAPTLKNASGQRLVIEASAGLTSRQPELNETGIQNEAQETGSEGEHAHVRDPHFWMDPILTIKYVENIRDGLSQADPEGRMEYTRNAGVYINQLKELDAWIRDQVDQVAPERRLIVTNHDSFGYYADRYGFEVVGTLIPSISSGASPSARELARLVDAIRASNAKAVFLEIGANLDLANQLELDTGITVVAGLYVESISAPSGEAASYIDMLKYDTRVFVEALR